MLRRKTANAIIEKESLPPALQTVKMESHDKNANSSRIYDIYKVGQI